MHGLTNMSLKSNISLSFVLQVVNIIIGFVTSIFIARLLGAEGRGNYVLVTTSSLFLMQALSFGIESSITYFVSSKQVHLRKLISTVFMCFLIICFFVATAVWIFSAYPSLKMVPADQTMYYVILFLLSVLYIANSFFSSLLNGIKEFKKVMFLTFLIQFLTFVAAAMFFFVWRQFVDAKIFLLSIVAINFLVLLVYLVYYKQLINILPANNPMNFTELKRFLTYSSISFICSLLQFLNYKMDFWIINFYYGNANLGVYSLSSTLAQLVWVLPQAIAFIMFPMSGYMQKEELSQVTNRLCRISVFLVMVALPFACVIALLIPFLFGNEFSGSVLIFYFFLIGIVPYVLIKIIASVFAGTGRVIYNFYASLLGFLVALVLYFLLIPLWGLTGGAIASSVSYMSTALVGIHLYVKKYGVKLKDLLWIQSNDLIKLFSLFREQK